MKYFYLKDDEKIGPLSLEKLSASDVNKDTLVWFQGLEDWTPMHQVKELKSILNSKPPPIPIGPPLIKKVKSTEANFNSMIYLDKNGITIKASENVVIGEEYELNGEKYKVVDEKMLREMVKNEEDVTRVVTSYVLDMYNLFRKANRFNQNISHWDVENVASMKGMFARASSFNRDIKNWNVSNVINMSEMFYGADAFNQDISSWDVSNVLNMNLMFANTEAFNQDLSSWNVRKETTQADIFKNTKSFKQDINKWGKRDLGSKNLGNSKITGDSIFFYFLWFLVYLGVMGRLGVLEDYFNWYKPLALLMFLAITNLVPALIIKRFTKTSISFAKILVIIEIIISYLLLRGQILLNQSFLN
jgi:surface protein